MRAAHPDPRIERLLETARTVERARVASYLFLTAQELAAAGMLEGSACVLSTAERVRDDPESLA